MWLADVPPGCGLADVRFNGGKNTAHQGRILHTMVGFADGAPDHRSKNSQLCFFFVLLFAVDSFFGQAIDPDMPRFQNDAKMTTTVEGSMCTCTKEW